MSESEKTELIGIINSIKENDNTILTVETLKSKKIFEVISPMKLPYEQGDEIYAVVHVKGDKAYIIKHPIVTIPETEESIKKMLYPIFKTKTPRIYEDLRTGRDPQVLFRHLSSLSCNYKRDNIGENPFPFIEDIKYHRLLDFWFKEKVYRQVNLLGIDQKEFLEYRTPINQSFYNDLRENPFLIYTISLEKADHVSYILNMNPTNEDRLAGSVVRKIYELIMTKGHAGVGLDFIVKFFSLDKKMIDYLILKYNVFVEYNTMYLKYFYIVEKTIAGCLIPRISEFPCSKINDKLSDDQKRAITFIFKHRISIVTGSAGTGKTTILKEIVSILERGSMNYRILAFTGKAVSRVKEVTGVDATTIHRFIAKPVQPDFLILDEISMVSNDLFYLLLAKIDMRMCRVIMVGDPNQLPPIDWGDFLNQAMKVIPVFKLTTQHRQESKDMVENFTRILGKEEVIPSDNFLINMGKHEKVLEIYKDLIKTNDYRDIVVITPLNNDCMYLNSEIQKLFREETGIITDLDLQDKTKYLFDQKKDRKFFIEDKVMMTENNYSFDVFNGDEGIVEMVYPDRITVRFGKKILDGLDTSKVIDFFVEYKNFDKKIMMIGSLIHSYCITVHRSQGSEWRFVIFYLDKFTNFVSNNLLYTAVTRAKKKIWIVGNEYEVNRAVKNQLERRLDNLAFRIHQLKESGVV